jgi:hypothetical protein
MFVIRDRIFYTLIKMSGLKEPVLFNLEENHKLFCETHKNTFKGTRQVENLEKYFRAINACSKHATFCYKDNGLDILHGCEYVDLYMKGLKTFILETNPSLSLDDIITELLKGSGRADIKQKLIDLDTNVSEMSQEKVTSIIQNIVDSKLPDSFPKKFGEGKYRKRSFIMATFIGLLMASTISYSPQFITTSQTTEGMSGNEVKYPDWGGHRIVENQTPIFENMKGATWTLPPTTTKDVNIPFTYSRGPIQDATLQEDGMTDGWSPTAESLKKELLKVLRSTPSEYREQLNLLEDSEVSIRVGTYYNDDYSTDVRSVFHHHLIDNFATLLWIPSEENMSPSQNSKWRTDEEVITVTSWRPDKRDRENAPVEAVTSDNMNMRFKLEELNEILNADQEGTLYIDQPLPILISDIGDQDKTEQFQNKEYSKYAKNHPELIKRIPLNTITDVGEKYVHAGAVPRPFHVRQVVAIVFPRT